MAHYHFRGASHEGSFARRHSLSLVLASILAVQTVVSLAAGRHVFVSEAQTHGTTTAWSEFGIWFLWEYNLSLLADTFGVILIVLLSKRLVEVGSVESKDDSHDGA